MRICTITKIRERQTKSKNLLVSSMEYLVWNSNDFSSKCSNDLDVKMKLMKVFEFLTDFESVVEYDPMKLHLIKSNRQVMVKIKKTVNPNNG